MSDTAPTTAAEHGIQVSAGQPSGKTAEQRADGWMRRCIDAETSCMHMGNDLLRVHELTYLAEQANSQHVHVDDLREAIGTISEPNSASEFVKAGKRLPRRDQEETNR